jgi:hypothetical protein
MTESLSPPVRSTSAVAESRGEVVEFCFLLPAGQALALETAAYQRGQTAGELVRRLVREFLNRPER